MADFCRLLARDGTPIITRLPAPEYLLVRIQECDYAVAPPTRPPVMVLPAAKDRTLRERRDLRDLKAIIRILIERR